MIYWIVIVSQLSDFLKWTVFRYLLLCVPHAQCSWADLTKEYSTMYWISAANVQELLLNPWRITIVNLCSLFFTSEHVSHSGAPSRWGICTWCKKPDLFESIATNRDKKTNRKEIKCTVLRTGVEPVTYGYLCTMLQSTALPTELSKGHESLDSVEYYQ